MSDKGTTVDLSPTLHLWNRDKQGFWLYDDTRGMNLAMRAATEQAALLEALEYYQERLQEVEAKYKALSKVVDTFVEQVRPEQDEDSRLTY